MREQSAGVVWAKMATAGDESRARDPHERTRAGLLAKPARPGLPRHIGHASPTASRRTCVPCTALLCSHLCRVPLGCESFQNSLERSITNSWHVKNGGAGHLKLHTVRQAEMRLHLRRLLKATTTTKCSSDEHVSATSSRASSSPPWPGERLRSHRLGSCGWPNRRYCTCVPATLSSTQGALAELSDFCLQVTEGAMALCSSTDAHPYKPIPSMRICRVRPLCPTCHNRLPRCKESPDGCSGCRQFPSKRLAAETPVCTTIDA